MIDFPQKLHWINTDPCTLKSLRNSVVLLHFWTASDMYSRRAVEQINAWNHRYSNDGLVVIGVHAPEFEFENSLEHVEREASRLGVNHGVVLDDGRLWKAYKNHWRPRRILMDADGNIVHDETGVGGYTETEREVREALRRSGVRAVGLETPQMCERYDTRVSAAKYFGCLMGAYEGNHIDARHRVVYGGVNTPRRRSSLMGEWRVEDSYAESFGGSVAVPYRGGEVNVVMGPGQCGGMVHVMTGSTRVLRSEAGHDIDLLDDRAVIRVNEPRLYNVLLARDVREDVLRLDVPAGVRIYAASFGGGCR